MERKDRNIDKYDMSSLLNVFYVFLFLSVKGHIIKMQMELTGLDSRLYWNSWIAHVSRNSLCSQLHTDSKGYHKRCHKKLLMKTIVM